MEPAPQGSRVANAAWRSQLEEKHSCDDRRNERTGPHFKAMELLRFAQISNDDSDGHAVHVHYDLQSFYWLLVWLVLRHTAHSIRHDSDSGHSGCYKLFEPADDLTASFRKERWINPWAWHSGNWERIVDFKVTDNAPLTALVEEFRDLISCAWFHPRLPPPVPLTYASVLRVFGKAVESPGWPASDFVPCTVALPRESVEHSVVSEQSGEAIVVLVEDADDPDSDGVADVTLEKDEDGDDDCRPELEEADLTCDNDPSGLDDTHPPENLSAPSIHAAADKYLGDAAGGPGSQQEPRGMTTRLRGKRSAGAAERVPPGSDRASKRRKTHPTRAPVVRNGSGSGSRGKAYTTGRGSNRRGRRS